MPGLPKSLSQLTADDISNIVTQQLPEDELLEFKRALPAAEGVEADRWVTRGDHVGETAQRGVFKEVVAFANTYGGDLVLGIEDSKDNPPPRAIGLTPIPRCLDLVERLAMAARNVIEPQIPRLEFRGIPCR
jgi:predicted HTH transcriptional regulator